MFIQLGSVLVVAVLTSSVMLLESRPGDRASIIAAAAASFELLAMLGIISTPGRWLAVLLAAAIVLAGWISWRRVKDKVDTTAATALFAAGAIQLVMALGWVR